MSAPTGSVTLVLGGARSGKSQVAETLASAGPAPVTYVATMTVGDDADLAARVAAHRARRPSTWATVEAGPDLGACLSSIGGTVLLDSLGPWVAAHDDDTEPAVDELCRSLLARRGLTVVVSDEVGLGVHPETGVGLRFRDRLGAVNQAVAAVADEVLLVVAGRVLPLAAPGGR